MRSRAGRELGGRDQIDVEAAVAVVVEQRDAAAARLEDVVLRGPAAVGPRGQPCGLFERHGRRRIVVGRRRRPGAGPMADAWPPYDGLLGRWSGCSCPGRSGRARLLPRAVPARARAAPGTGPVSNRALRVRPGRGRRARALPVAARRAAPARAGAPAALGRPRARPARRRALRAAGRRREARAAPRRSAHPVVPPASAGSPPRVEAPGAVLDREPPAALASWPRRPHTVPGKRRARARQDLERASRRARRPFRWTIGDTGLHSGPDSPTPGGPGRSAGADRIVFASVAYCVNDVRMPARRPVMRSNWLSATAMTVARVSEDSNNGRSQGAMRA